jgi:RNA polymerase sigma-70 factor (ECF subfamily)
VDKSEFTKAVLEAEPTLYHISKSILKNEHDCADAVQESILKAFVKLDTLREPAFFKTWLCRIVINECCKVAKAAKRTVTYDEYIETTNGIHTDTNIELGLYEAIMKLKPKLRLAVTLHYVEGFSIAETAKMLKIPQGTVKSRLSKARAELKFSLESEEKEEHYYERNAKCVPGRA